MQAWFIRSVLGCGQCGHEWTQMDGQIDDKTSFHLDRGANTKTEQKNSERQQHILFQGSL